MKSIFSTLCILLIALTTAAQTGEIIPPSPSMGTLQRFTDYPVNHSTGLVDITIPLYEVKLRDYSLPISIKFHASGRKWSGSFSSMGVGWSLDAGGFVSREIRERPDENYEGLETTVQTLEYNSANNIEFKYDRLVSADMNVPNGFVPENGNTEDKKDDSEHDMFTYSAGPISGKFVIDKYGHAFPLVYNNYRISASAGMLGGCLITDEQGTIYSFGDQSSAIETVWNTTRFGSQSLITGALLSRIERPSGETITFSYGQTRTDIAGAPRVDRLRYMNINYGRTSQLFEMMGNSSAEIGDYLTNHHEYHETYVTSSASYDITVPQQITFPGGKVTFDYNSDYFVTGFHVFDINNREIRSGTFTYISTPGTTALGTVSPSASRSLQNLVIKDAAGQPALTYSFDYYNDGLTLNSDYTSSPSTDWWGYCGAGGNKPPYDPNDPNNGGITLGVPYWTKEPSLFSVRSGMLKKIHYPTGGTTEFVYELNQYHDGNLSPRNGPGLRIQKVISDEGSGVNRITKLYKYGALENGVENGKGYLYRVPTVDDFKFQRTYGVFLPANGYIGIDYTITSYFPTPITSMQEAYAQPVYYERVTEYTVADNGDKNGMIVYLYSLPQYLYTGTSIRKKEWTGGLLLNKSTYSLDQPTTPKESVSYGYTQLHYSAIPQLRIWRSRFAKGEDGNSSRAWERDRAQMSVPFFQYYDFPYESAVMKQTSVSHTIGGVTTNSLTYYEDPDYMFPTRTESTISTGEKTSQEMQYAFDFGSAYNTILQKNWLFPVETSVYRMNSDNSNKRLVSSELITWNTSKGVPLTIHRTKPNLPIINFVPAYTQAGAIVKDNNYVVDHSFDQYGTKGNLLMAHKPNDLFTTYLWDATGTYPLAEVKGEIYGTISALDGKPADYNSATLYNSIKALAPSAVINTYSYSPLVGMTSQTDTNGRTTYFGYDAFGRLETIRDHEFNIVKKFTYHYKQ